MGIVHMCGYGVWVWGKEGEGERESAQHEPTKFYICYPCADLLQTQAELVVQASLAKQKETTKAFFSWNGLSPEGGVKYLSLQHFEK